MQIDSSSGQSALDMIEGHELKEALPLRKLLKSTSNRASALSLFRDLAACVFVAISYIHEAVRDHSGKVA